MQRLLFKICTVFFVFSLSVFAGNCSNADDDDVQYDLSPEIITDPYWQEIIVTNSPSPRDSAMSAHDPENDKLLLFGGRDYQPPDDTQYLGDTWEFSNGEWRQIDTPVSPSPRHRGRMCYCNTWHKFILFGGNYVTTRYRDTWSYDHINGWEELSPVHKPEARFDFGMTFDERLGKVLVFGGDRYDVNQFWMFDGNDWEIATGDLPPPRRNVHMVYDRNRQVTVLFGGYVNLYYPDNDTWEFDGQRWRKMHPIHNPTPRFGTNICYYSAQKKCVLFGGGVIGPEFNDTWTYDGNDWEHIVMTTSPPVRTRMSLDGCGNKVIMFGGVQDGIINLGDTWAYSIIEETTSTPAMSPLVIAVLILLFTALLLFFGYKHKMPF